MTHHRLHFQLLCFATCLLLTLQHQCAHDQVDHDIKISDESYAMYPEFENRVLQSYQNINIRLDSSPLNNVTADFKDYIINSLIPPIINYFEAAIKVPSRSTNLKAGGFSSLCSDNVAIPSYYNTQGVDADLIIFMNAKNEPNASYVAMASACLLDTQTKRPVIGRVTFNVAKMGPTTNDANRESDIVTTMHELTHVLGFSSSLYQYYTDPVTKKALTGHVTTKKSFGLTTTIIDVEPLTTRLKAYFNCSSVEGAYIENQGGSGSAGSHFERRVFYNEYMTASALIDTRISEFALALLEGTGWYQINYDMAEPMTWGKNKGCNFVAGSCVDPNTKTANFDEFCTPLAARGCSWTKRAGSTCGIFNAQTNPSLPKEMNYFGNNLAMQDSFGDNCPIRLPYSNLDCEDPDNQGGATITGETYGYGSKCFMATLYPRGTLTQSYPYCFKSQCKLNSQGDYYVELKIGGKTITCTSESQVSVTGYSGKLYCPDPNDFCAQADGEGYCRRKCSGRGTCVNKQCACVEGWSGFDCSKPTSLNNCARCANDDPLRTTCLGDQCVCDPNNSTCMCLLGLKTGRQCDAIIAAATPIDTISNSTGTVPTTTTTVTQDTSDGTASDATENNINNTASTSRNTTTSTNSTAGTTARNTTSTVTNSTSGTTSRNATQPSGSPTTNTSTSKNTTVASNNTTPTPIDEITTIDATTSVVGTGQDMTNKNTHSDLIPIIFGALGGMILTISAMVIFNYIRKSKKVKIVIAHNNHIIKPLEISANKVTDDVSIQNSPTLFARKDSRVTSIIQNHDNSSPYCLRNGSRINSIIQQDSPLITRNSPERQKLYSPSLFKMYGSVRNSPELPMGPLNLEHGISIQPVEMERKADPEDPPMMKDLDQIVPQEQVIIEETSSKRSKAKSKASLDNNENK